MRMLCVTSCTAKKDNKPGVAGLFYKGLQHKYALEGIQNIRKVLGSESIDFNIISAKYGLLNELDIIEPYDVSFNTMKHDEIIKTARELNIHRDMQRKVADYNVVFYLLGIDYLKALELPFLRDGLTNHMFLISPTYKSLIEEFTHERRRGHSDYRTNYFTFDCGSNLGLELGVQNIALKGFIFKEFGKHLNADYHRARDIRRTLVEDPEKFQEWMDYLIYDRRAKLEEAKKEVSKQMNLF